MGSRRIAISRGTRLIVSVSYTDGSPMNHHMPILDLKIPALDQAKDGINLKQMSVYSV